MQAYPRAAAFALCASVALSACGGGSHFTPSATSPGGAGQTSTLGATRTAQVGELPRKIKHVIVIYQENWSFDSLYGSFPGANGLANAGAGVGQVDKSGNPLTTLPQVLGPDGKPDPRFPADLPVEPYSLARYAAPSSLIGDLVHRFYHEQLQIDAGKMDKFVSWSDNGGEVLGYFDASNGPEGKLAQEFVMADNLFHSAFGGSFLNHQWLICACTPKWPGAPSNAISNPDPNQLNDARVTPDGYAINTAYTINKPHPASVTDPQQLVPELTDATIGDRLSAANVSWAWYSGGWNDALAGHPDPTFQFHHQPFAYYANYADGKPAKAEHLKDEGDFLTALSSEKLPAVSFIKPLGANNEHPGYAALTQGQQHVADLVNAVRQSRYWHDTAIFITYDENGGFWDHVAPPHGDRWGPGSRVPGIIVSPFARRHFVDHTQYETVSILKFIEERWNLQPLGTRDASANDLLNAFDFTQQVGGGGEDGGGEREGR